MIIGLTMPMLFGMRKSWPAIPLTVVWSSDGFAHHFEVAGKGQELHMDQPDHPVIMSHKDAAARFSAMWVRFWHVGDAVPLSARPKAAQRVGPPVKPKASQVSRLPTCPHGGSHGTARLHSSPLDIGGSKGCGCHGPQGTGCKSQALPPCPGSAAQGSRLRLLVCAFPLTVGWLTLGAVLIWLEKERRKLR